MQIQSFAWDRHIFWRFIKYIITLLILHGHLRMLFHNVMDYGLFVYNIDII